MAQARPLNQASFPGQNSPGILVAALTTCSQVLDKDAIGCQPILRTAQLICAPSVLHQPRTDP